VTVVDEQAIKLYRAIRDVWQVSVETIVPLNSQGGHGLGIRTQLLLFLMILLGHSLRLIRDASLSRFLTESPDVQLSTRPRTVEPHCFKL
jgi:hypothetical protein